MVRGADRNAMRKMNKSNPLALLGLAVEMFDHLLDLVLGTVLQEGCELENISKESNENQV